MLKKFLITLVAVFLVLLVVISVQSDEFNVTRTITISTAPSVVFSHVNDLQKWEAWSPWAKLDPNAKTTFEGPSSGDGAIMRWAGNNEVGEGSMTIVESRPDELVRFRLDFIKPFAGTNSAEFVFKPENNYTTVTWSMSGKKNFIAKAVGLVMNCDKIVGEQFEKGLARLKGVVEAK